MQHLQLLHYDLSYVTAPSDGTQQGDHADFVQFLMMLVTSAIQHSGFLLSSKTDQ